jgi:trehalose synthase-fused probable maltokinase
MRRKDSSMGSWLDSIEIGQRKFGVQALEREILPDYLLRCRWYASKDRGRPSVTILRVISISTGDPQDVLVAILEVEPPESPPEQYLLALGFTRAAMEPSLASYFIVEARLGGRAGFLIDAAADDAFLGTLLKMICDGCEGEMSSTDFTIHQTHALPTLEGEIRQAGIKRGDAEQSNTSVILGDVAVLKLMRKLQNGVHPEPEISGFLTEVANFSNTPALLAFLECRTAKGPMLLSVLQAFVPNEGDGWKTVLGRLKGNLDRNEELVDARTLEIARQVGVRTAGMHKSFATMTSDQAFTPEPVTVAILDSWINSVEEMARRAIRALEQAALSMPEVALVQALLGGRETVFSAINAARPADLSFVRSRIHGDYHLGQVLIASNDVYIVDFEGEPMRPLSERRQKHSPLRDVAGMLRSIAYAAGVARQGTHVASSPQPFRAWTDAVSDAFLSAYRGNISDCPSYPSEAASANKLLTLFLLEKVLYEVCYELANRPSWVHIPLEGAVDLLRLKPWSATSDTSPL